QRVAPANGVPPGGAPVEPARLGEQRDDELGDEEQDHDRDQQDETVLHRSVAGEPARRFGRRSVVVLVVANVPVVGHGRSSPPTSRRIQLAMLVTGTSTEENWTTSHHGRYR